MNRRRVVPELDPAAWSAFDTGALPKKQRSSFNARRRAVELYAANTAVADIERRTGVDRRQLYRLLDHCAAPHDDGRVFGWRALVPYTRVADYQRVTKVELSRDGAGSVAVGAFGVLLQAHPTLATWIAECVRSTRIAVHQISTDLGLRIRLPDFLRQCRTPGPHRS